MKKAKKKLLIRASAALSILPLVLSSCGAAGRIRIPAWPEGWVVEKEETESRQEEKASGNEDSKEGTGENDETAEPQETGKADKATRSPDVLHADEKTKLPDAGQADEMTELSDTGQADKTESKADEAIMEKASGDLEDEASSQEAAALFNGCDNFYPDLSQSGGAYESIDMLYGLIMDAEGGTKLRCWGADAAEEKLVEIDRKKIFGKKDYTKSPLDYMMAASGSYDPGGANILVTDMMSITGSEFGEWLVSTGSESFSFYVFNMPFNGNIDFYGFPLATSEEQKHFHVINCILSRDLLMVVFGSEKRVGQFDERFKSSADMDSFSFEHSHITRLNEGSSGFAMKPAPCFTENLPNITYEGTYFNYGLSLVKPDDDAVFTLADTYVFKKSRYSANERKKAVKAVLYGIPNRSLGMNLEAGCSVQEYDRKEKIWKESSVTFDISLPGFLDGFPASEDAKTNERLGGNIVPEGRVCSLFIENNALPRGLYAIEATLVFDAAENAESLLGFARKHSAGMAEYMNALEKDCTLEKHTTYVLKQNAPEAFGRLLDFQGMVSELAASGFSDPEAQNTRITVRVIIDNR